MGGERAKGWGEEKEEGGEGREEEKWKSVQCLFNPHKARVHSLWMPESCTVCLHVIPDKTPAYLLHKDTPYPNLKWILT